MTTVPGSCVSTARAALELHAPGGGSAGLEDLYTLLLLVKGEDCSPEDVHHVWSVWRVRDRPLHPTLVPFDALSDENKQWTRDCAEILRRAARALADASEGAVV